MRIKGGSSWDIKLNIRQSISDLPSWLTPKVVARYVKALFPRLDSVQRKIIAFFTVIILFIVFLLFTTTSLPVFLESLL